MNKIKSCPLFRITCAALLITFIALDISWAYPPELSSGTNTLATQSIFQKQMMDEASQRFQRSILSNAALLASIHSISSYLLGDAETGANSLPLKYLESTLASELGKVAEGVDLTKILINDGVILIPYEREGKKYVIQVALKNTVSAKDLIGYEWVVSDKYIVKVVPQDYKETTATTHKNDKEAEVTITKPIAEIKAPRTEGENLASQNITFKIRAIITTAFLLLLSPATAFGGYSASKTVSSVNILGGLQNFVLTHPIIITIAMVATAGIGIGVFFVAWRVLFPVKWYLWRLRKSSHRYHAAMMLSEIGLAAVPALIKALNDDDIRRDAINVLRNIGPAAVPAVPALIETVRVMGMMGKVTDALGKMGLAAVPTLIEALEDEDWRVRDAAAIALGKIGPAAKDAIPALIKTLEDEKRDVRRNAAEAVGKIGPAIKEAVLPILIKILEDEDWVIRKYAAGALYCLNWQPETEQQKISYLIAKEDWWAVSKIGKPAVPFLIRRLEYVDDVDGEVDFRPEIRTRAADVLGMIGPAAEDAVPALISNLGTFDEKVRNFSKTAADTLAQIGKPAIPALEKALKSDSDHVRRGAAYALANIQQLMLEQDIIVAQVIQELEQKSISTRELFDFVQRKIPSNMQYLHNALEALKSLSRQKSLEANAISQAITKEKEKHNLSEEETRILWLALTGLPTRPKGDSATHLSIDPATVLIGIGGIIMALSWLTKFVLTHPIITAVAMAAAVGVGVGLFFVAWRVFFPVNWYVWRLKSPDISIRESYMEALAKIGPAALPDIFKALEKYKDFNFTFAVIKIFAKIGPEILPTLIEALKEKSDIVRGVATEALGNLGPAAKSSIPAIIEALENNRVIHSTAIEALGKIGPHAVPALIKVLKDEPNYRHEVAEALGKIGPPAKLAVPALIEVLEYESPDDRKAAAEALEKLGALTTELKIKRYVADLEFKGMHGGYLRRALMVVCDAAEGLAEIGPAAKPAIPTLIRILKTAPNNSDLGKDVFAAAVKALGEISTADAVPLFIEVLKNEDVYWFFHPQKVVAKALGKIGPAAIPAVPILIETLKDKNQDVRNEAAWALGKIGDPRAIEPLKKAGYQSISEELEKKLNLLGNIRTSVMKELKGRKRIGHRELFSLVQSKVPETMENLRRVLEKLKPLSEQKGVTADIISEAITEATLYNEFSIEENCILWLALTGFPTRPKGNSATHLSIDPVTGLITIGGIAMALSWLKELILAHSIITAIVVVCAGFLLIVRCGLLPVKWYSWLSKYIKIPKPAIPSLIKALENKKRDIRDTAFRLLEGLGVLTNELKIKKYIADLQDFSGFTATSGDHRKAAAEALGKIKDSRTLWPLLKALKDEAASVRGAVGRALIAIGDRRLEVMGKYFKDASSGEPLTDRQLAAIVNCIQQGKKFNIIYIDPLTHTEYREGYDDVWTAHIVDMPLQLCIVIVSSDYYTIVADEIYKIKREKFADMNALIKYLKARIYAQYYVHYVKKEPSDQREPSQAYILRELEALGPAMVTKVAIPIFLKALTDKDDLVRYNAERILMELKDPSIAPPLLNTLKSEDWDVRQRAARILDKLGYLDESGHPRAIEPWLVRKADYQSTNGGLEKKLALNNIRTSVMKELKGGKRISHQELFTLVQSKVPESMENLLWALAELNPLSAQKNVTADTISKAITEAKEKYSLSEGEVRILWLALTGPGQGSGGIEKGIAQPESPTTSQTSRLFEAVESAVNNGRTKFVNVGNRLILSVIEREDLDVQIDKQELDKQKITAMVKNRVEKLITSIEKLDIKELPEGVKSDLSFLKSNLDQFEADGIVGTIIALARRAKRDNQNLIIGLETDWIPGYQKGMLQHSAIHSLIRELETLGDTLRSLGLDNVVTVHSKSDDLASDLLREADRTSTKLSNIVALASNSTISSSTFAPLRSTPTEKRAFLAGIDSRELIKFYTENKESLDKQLCIQIMEMLSITLELALGKEVPSLPIIASYDENLRIIVFLPKAEPIDYQELQRFYKMKRLALQSA